ncbi:aldo/keto reductase [Aquimarina agarivorans]|uniref:aldo/keto reductase n=1 Tax=Aquimarina agarivorans TaxID=980584 RepID=UPI000248ED59|nr:aldo/keto reductase [Aquimarina agarivorans]
MKYTNLPGTDIQVSKICLGTMTWGTQNTEAEGHTQMDFAIENGVNFFDAAELYPTPFDIKKQGDTERIIGTWLKKNNNRDQVIVASKIVGPRAFVKEIRNTIDFSKASLDDAIHKSLERLQTDYIDLYQLHWPERNTNFFGLLGYTHQEDEAWSDNFQEVLQALESYVKQGKIRHIGVSNESPYGLMRYIEEARKGAQKISTVQNPYSLLNRKDEIGLTEVLHREDVGYLAYSPLGFGQLTGKYLDETPADGRVTKYPQFSRYHNEQSFDATRAYREVALKHGISLTDMSLAFINQQPFITSNIIGATSVEQLKENIGSIDVVLSEEIMKDINAVHKQFPNPAP